MPKPTQVKQTPRYAFTKPIIYKTLE